MKFPIINYKFNDLEEAQDLTGVVEQKFSSLEKFIQRDNSGTCDVEFSKVASHQSGRIYNLGVNLMIEGALYRAEATEDSFEKAIDEVRSELDKEMRRAKDKQVTMEKQAGREMKEKMLMDE